MLAVVIGYGSIGQRHCRVLEEMGVTVSVVSRRAADGSGHHRQLADALTEQTGYVVVANETALHASTLSDLSALGWSGKTLVEKPLFSNTADVPETLPAGPVYTGYNLRFLPVLQQLHALARETRVLSIEAHCGQWLPDWRPGRDYRQTASASRQAGGGVLRDLSHELDYVCWLAGPWKRVFATGGRVSDLEIDVEDSVSLLIETEGCRQVAVSLNYLDRPAGRHVTLNTASGTIRADLLTGKLTVNGEGSAPISANDVATTYQRLHQAILHENGETVCTFEDALDVVHLIDAAEQSLDRDLAVHREH